MTSWRRAWWLSLVIIIAGSAGAAWLMAREPAADAHQSEDHQERHDANGGDHHGREQSSTRRTTIAPEAAESAGLRTTRAGPATLVETVALTGTVQADPARLADVRPRYAGIVRTVHAEIGQRMQAGDVVAVVESNDSLQTFEVLAPIDGVVLSRDIQVGQVVGDQPLFRLVDISEVWIQLDVFGRDLARVREGQEVSIETIDGQQLTGRIDWLSPLVTHGSQSLRARVIAPNPEGRLRPGQFVSARVVIDRHEVPLAVRREAVQTLDGEPVAFVRSGDTYEARPLELGRNDHSVVAVRAGLQAGEEYVVSNSYLVKADLEKASAAHHH